MNTYAAWAHPQLAAHVLRSRRDGRSEIALRVSLLDSRQVLRLEQRIHALDGVHRVAIDRPAQRVRVVWDARRSSLPTLLDAFAMAGCPAQPLQHDSINDHRSGEMHNAMKRLLVAGMCAMQVMTYAFVIYIGAVDFVDFSTRNLFRWLGLITTIPLVFYSAQPFFAGALRELHEHRLGIHLPVALAVALVFLASAFNTLRGSGEIYFDSVSMFVFLLLGARYLELSSRHRSSALGDAVIDAVPLLAQRRGVDGELETVAAITLLPGDRVHIAEGSTVPADGMLESAHAQVDEALLSGESRPVHRTRGERLIAGSVLLSGPAELRVEHSGDTTTVARIGALATRARQARDLAGGSEPEIARFVGRVLLLTALTAIGWLLIDPQRAFDAAIAVLVVACPCAFALTLPAASTRALAFLARHGVLVTNAAALATLANVDSALFDKTGTLGTTRLELGAIEPLRGDSREQVLAWAAALARESSHPIARALADAARPGSMLLRAKDVRVTAGQGIQGDIDGRELRLGRANFALAFGHRRASPDLADGLLLADADGALASLHVDEQPRTEARAVLDALRADGIEPCIASGDSADRVASLAAKLDIANWHARQTPTDKLALLQAMRARSAVTLVVGDGSNDALALAAADVSAALASGTALAQAHADLLLDGRLDGLVHARAIARQMQHVIVQSRRWTLGYNLCAVPFAAFGFVPPWLAGIGMSLSSLMVVLQALRIGRGTAKGTLVPQRGLPA
ncbi:MAG: heavy metal translocating P-type ATPase [Rhodanobacter sp.]